LQYKDSINKIQEYLNKNSIDLYNDMLKNTIHQFENLPKYKSSDILKEKITKYTKTLTDIKIKYDGDIKKLKEEEVTIQNKLNILSNKTQLYDLLNNQINDINNEILTLSKTVDGTIDNKYITKVTELNNTKVFLNKCLYASKMINKQTDLENKRTTIIQKNKDLTHLHEIMQIAFDLECDQLQKVVDNINVTVNLILKDMFFLPIQTTLNLYKKNKINEKIKASVNLSLIYNGNEYSEISVLSGGEKDRLSLAYTLALSMVNGSPFLLLDETLRSLNYEHRNLCIDCIKSTIGESKTVLCINHEDVEGNYDCIIDLE